VRVGESDDRLEDRVVTRRAGGWRRGTPEETLRGRVLAAFRHPFEIGLTYCDQIARTPGGKFEDFRSEVDGAAEESSTPR
jgi:hypothetical protein